MEEKIRVVVSGRVQGIGYRSFVQRYAKILGIKGYIRNLPDNKVEAVLCGKKEDVEELIKIMKRNHPLAKIEDMKIEKIKTETNFSDFHILY